jgi:carbamate kinase
MALVIVAIGGNSLLADAEHVSFADQLNAAGKTAEKIADLVAAGWSVGVTHGNGPQVGFQLRRSELGKSEAPEHPLDVCDADTQGSIGYALLLTLQNAFAQRELDTKVAALLTRVEVDAGDPAFSHPEKPIGPFFSQEEAREKEDRLGWTLREDSGRGYRRVVPSPLPRAILELDALDTLLAAGVVVVAVGGGGIPVVRGADGDYKGVAAVVDKDLATSLWAKKAGAEVIVFSTKVSEVKSHFGTPREKAIRHMSAAEAQALLDEGIHFAPGSMAPKVRAAIEFVAAGGKRAVITDPEHIQAALAGGAGTTIVA